ncbi:MAG TPA: HAMP domain-containing sensor histidine kinase [Mariprofundaceae bacterium]|nr:HAMP domain-containing sensor histidine kinase [Mariprofundaceae bacterium]
MSEHDQGEYDQRKHDEREMTRFKDEMSKLIHLFSHDMRNPLVNMKALLSEVRLSFEGEKQGDVHLLDQGLPETLQMLDQSVERLNAMIEGANAIYHCMFDPLEYEEIELKALVERVVHRFGDPDTIEIKIAETTTLWADPLAVGSMVESLLKNSLWATDAEGSITVSFKRQAGFDDLIIADSGRGIPNVVLEQLFEPFYSGPDQQKSATAGMGLTLVKSLAEAHGGRVRCESRAGEGATFYISLPHQSAGAGTQD